MCQPTSTINAALQTNMRIELIMTDYYFDTNDYDNPVKISRQNDLFFTLILNSFQEKILKIRANDAEDYPSYLQNISPDENDYLQVGSLKEDLRVAQDSELFVMNFELDQAYISTERKAYTFLDVISQVGGFMGFLIPIGAVLVGILSNQIYWTTLLSTFYDIET